MLWLFEYVVRRSEIAYKHEEIEDLDEERETAADADTHEGRILRRALDVHVEALVRRRATQLRGAALLRPVVIRREPVAARPAVSVAPASPRRPAARRFRRDEEHCVQMLSDALEIWDGLKSKLKLKWKMWLENLSVGK